MKNLILILLPLFSLCSCVDQLDIAPDGKLSYEDIFADDEKTGAFLNSTYKAIPVKGNTGNFCRGPVVWCDDAWDADAGRVVPWGATQQLYSGNINADHQPIYWYNANKYYWDSFWNGIRDCNIFLLYIDGAAVNSEANKRRWKAEAFVLRAWFYAEMIRWYGMGVPISKVPYRYDEDFTQLRKDSYYNVVKSIIDDCNQALAIPELPWRITTAAEDGRVTKALAEAIKSRMILYAASTLYNEGNDYWEEAYEVNKVSLQALRSNGYELYGKVNYPATYSAETAYFGTPAPYTQYAALYNEYFTNEMSYSSNPVDKETIYQDWRSYQGSLYDTEGPAQGVRSGVSPTQEMIDAYETSDGKPILVLSDPYLDEKHTQPNFDPANTMYDETDPYVGRDPRFYASIYYNGSKRKAYWPFAEESGSYENYPASVGNRVRIIATYVNEPRSGIHPSALERRHQTRTGYYLRKFLHPNSGNDLMIVGARWKHFRLGEVILNFAEAAAEAGYLPEATAAVNEIRARVNMPPIPDDLSQQELILRVRHERRVELAFEEFRYFDVRRWSRPDGDLAKTDKWLTAAEITRVSNGVYTWIRRPVTTNHRMCYTNKFLKGPLTIDEASRLKSITGVNWQNPGW